MTWLLLRCLIVFIVAMLMITWALIPNDTDCEWEVEHGARDPK